MRKKMYKKGKFWVVATIALAATAVGAETVQADEDVDNSTASSAVVTEKEAVVETSVSTSSQPPVLDESAVVSNSSTVEKTVTSVPSTIVSDSTSNLVSNEISEPADKTQESPTSTSSVGSSTSNPATVPQAPTEEYHRAATGGAVSDKSVETTPSANVSVENIDNVAGSYDVVISNVVAPNGMNGVVVPTWTENKGQDDIIWGNATKQADGSYRYTVKSSDHKGEGGLYNSHVYIVEKDGNFAWGGGKQVTLNLPQASATVSIENINHTAGTYDVVISDLVTPKGMQRIVVPTWTEKNGQDDILWNNAVKQSNGTYRLTVKASDHKGEGGLYNSHVYIVENDGNFAWGGGKQVTLNLPQASATVAIENINHTAGTYDVVISNLVTPKGVQRIVVPTWTEKNGQDDILWNNAVKQSNGTYRLTVKASDHKGEGGLYNSHVYIVENDGNFAWGGGKQVTLNLPQASATVAIENVNHTAGTYDVVISNLVTPKGVQRIVVPTWTEKNGQDDILWNNAVKQSDGTYRLTVKASDHKGEGGLYNSHVYIVENDGNFAWGDGKQVTLNLPQASATVAIENINHTAGTYDVVISNLVTPKGVQRIVVPTWTEKNGQDDILWNNAVKQSDGTYRLTVKASDHKGEGGLYNSHVYIVENDGNFAWGGGKQVTLNLPQASATVSIENINNTAGTYDVVISNLVTPKGVQRIVVPTWTEKNGQDDILWNNAVKLSDGTYRLTIKASEHRWESGKYNSHVYIVESDGNFAWGGALTTNLTIPRSSIRSVITPSYKGTGGYDVKIDFAPEGGEVLFAVWSEKGGQDDLIWYTAKHVNGGSYQGFFNAQNHKDTGTYNIHAYQKVDGQMNFLAATTVNVAKSAYNAPYYSQRDARWGGKVYGVGNMHDTGCVPTTLAMAISAIKDKAVLPTEIADYLYHNTDTFNKRFAGSSGKAIALASKNWGLSSTVLSSESDISKALADGHYVTAAVGGGSFTSGFVTHEILLKGNVDGKTYVLDPYTPSNNRWFPISYISSIRSTDKDDNSEGAPFFKITDI